jgi:hypothetical protein
MALQGARRTNSMPSGQAPITRYAALLPAFLQLAAGAGAVNHGHLLSRCCASRRNVDRVQPSSCSQGLRCHDVVLCDYRRSGVLATPRQTSLVGASRGLAVGRVALDHGGGLQSAWRSAQHAPTSGCCAVSLSADGCRRWRVATLYVLWPLLRRGGRLALTQLACRVSTSRTGDWISDQYLDYIWRLQRCLSCSSSMLDRNLWWTPCRPDYGSHAPPELVYVTFVTTEMTWALCCPSLTLILGCVSRGWGVRLRPALTHRRLHHDLTHWLGSTQPLDNPALVPPTTSKLSCIRLVSPVSMSGVPKHTTNVGRHLMVEPQLLDDLARKCDPDFVLFFSRGLLTTGQPWGTTYV